MKRLLAVMLFLVMIPLAGAAELKLTDINGESHRLSDYRGKWVVVNYWATWCPPCLEELPELVHFHDQHKDKDAVVLGINYEDVDLDTLHGFVDDYLISYPILRGQPGEPSPLGNIPGLPTTYVVTPKGDVVARQVGPVTAEMLEEFIEQQKLVKK